MGRDHRLVRMATGTGPLARDDVSDLERARMLFAQRRVRDRAAGPHRDLFSDPGWDLVLALFIAFEEDRRVATSAVAPLIGLSDATAGRWIATLIGRDLAIRSHNAVRPSDAYLSLTAGGVAFMLRCLAAW